MPTDDNIDEIRRAQAGGIVRGYDVTRIISDEMVAPRNYWAFDIDFSNSNFDVNKPQNEISFKKECRLKKQRREQAEKAEKKKNRFKKIKWWKM